MPVHLLKPLLLPLLILVIANLAAIAWRAIPQGSDNLSEDAGWQTLELPAAGPDVREGLLAGGHWGVAESNPADRAGADGVDSDDTTPEATVQALSKHIQRQLQGIIRRGDWVLLFAQPGTADNSPTLPLELRSGDVLPDTPWVIGQIWADRIQLMQGGHDPLIVPLYPIAESVTEP